MGSLGTQLEARMPQVVVQEIRHDKSTRLDPLLAAGLEPRAMGDPIQNGFALHRFGSRKGCSYGVADKLRVRVEGPPIVYYGAVLGLILRLLNFSANAVQRGVRCGFANLERSPVPYCTV